MAKEIREGMALRLHTQNRALLRVVYEQSSLNCSWEDLPEYWKQRYRSDAILEGLKKKGEGAPYDPERDDYRKRIKTEVSKLQEVRYAPLGDGYTPIMRDATVDEVVEKILDMFV